MSPIHQIPFSARTAQSCLTPLLVAALALPLTGCIQRKIRITSEPAGALVRLNDVEIGRTPVEADFRFHGTYDVQLNLDGYEPILEGRKAKAPVWEWPGIDLAATVIPAQFDNTIEWHFDLEPTPERSLPPAEVDTQLIERATELRNQATTPPVE